MTTYGMAAGGLLVTVPGAVGASPSPAAPVFHRVGGCVVAVGRRFTVWPAPRSFIAPGVIEMDLTPEQRFELRLQRRRDALDLVAGGTSFDDACRLAWADPDDVHRAAPSTSPAPSPAEIQRRAAEIRSRWTDAERRGAAVVPGRFPRSGVRWRFRAARPRVRDVPP